MKRYNLNSRIFLTFTLFLSFGLACNAKAEENRTFEPSQIVNLHRDFDCGVSSNGFILSYVIKGKRLVIYTNAERKRIRRSLKVKYFDGIKRRFIFKRQKKNYNSKVEVTRVNELATYDGHKTCIWKYVNNS